jgi:hypothetical protein
MNAARTAGSDRGFALPAVLLVLIGLGLLLAASSHAARLDLKSSRSLAGAIRAFQGAEAGLALLDAGAWPDPEVLGDVRVRLETTLDTLWRSSDGTLLVRARVRALAHDPAGRRTAVRTLETLYLHPSGATARRFSGTWREIVRQDS